MSNEKYLELNPQLRQTCEIWTRAMGYVRPVSCFNMGKQAEYRERVPFTMERALNTIEFRERKVA